MNEIIFATGNSGKIATLRRNLEVEGVGMVVVQNRVELIEPQAFTAAEVARVKARQAYSQLQKPVLVDDSSFHISALGGFPGPYIRYMLDTVGAEGIVKFMAGQKDRTAYFMSSLVFIDENGNEHEFHGQDEKGQIVEKMDEYDHPSAWSDLWKIFAPPGETKTYSQMSDAEIMANRRKDMKTNAYRQFAVWLRENS